MKGRQRKGRRLVLDTNLFLGLQEPVLQALTRAGHAVMVSVIALEERLARAAIKDDIAPLQARFSRVGRYVNPARPLAPLGGPFFSRLGIHPGDEAKRRGYENYNHTLPQTWKRLATTADPNDWRDLAANFSESIERNADFTLAQLATLRRVPLDGLTYERFRHAMLQDCSHPIADRLGVERIDAFVSRLTWMAYHIKEAEPSRNDVEDLELLQHLADDVILLTDDTRFVEHVDKTGSPQAPFVRTPWEILDGSLPDGPPWGYSAVRASRAHVQRTRAGLGDIKARVALQLGLS